jgi:hypothetical protein
MNGGGLGAGGEGGAGKPGVGNQGQSCLVLHFNCIQPSTLEKDMHPSPLASDASQHWRNA